MSQEAHHIRNFCAMLIACFALGAAVGGEDAQCRKRARTTFTADQVKRLEKVFQTTHYPDVQMRESLCRDTALPESRIQVRQNMKSFLSPSWLAENCEAERSSGSSGRRTVAAYSLWSFWVTPRQKRGCFPQKKRDLPQQDHIFSSPPTDLVSKPKSQVAQAREAGELRWTGVSEGDTNRTSAEAETSARGYRFTGKWPLTWTVYESGKSPQQVHCSPLFPAWSTPQTETCVDTTTTKILLSEHIFIVSTQSKLNWWKIYRENHNQSAERRHRKWFLRISGCFEAECEWKCRSGVLRARNADSCSVSSAQLLATMYKQSKTKPGCTPPSALCSAHWALALRTDSAAGDSMHSCRILRLPGNLAGTVRCQDAECETERRGTELFPRHQHIESETSSWRTQGRYETTNQVKVHAPNIQQTIHTELQAWIRTIFRPFSGEIWPPLLQASRFSCICFPLLTHFNHYSYAFQM